jgi:hypothetical protein
LVLRGQFPLIRWERYYLSRPYYRLYVPRFFSIAGVAKSVDTPVDKDLPHIVPRGLAGAIGVIHQRGLTEALTTYHDIS